MEDLIIGFGDTVRLSSSEIGTVRFIGHTEFKQNVVFYGIHLKEPHGKHNGAFNKIRYFKCPKSHGLFVEKHEIVNILKKHSLSASFHYLQNVQIQSIGLKGKLSYIGFTKYDNYKNYFYGVQLLNDIDHKQIKQNQHIYILNKSDKNHYFNADAKQSIFVRQNQLQCITQKPKKYKKRDKQQPAFHRSLSMQPAKKPKSKTKHKHKDKVKQQPPLQPPDDTVKVKKKKASKKKGGRDIEEIRRMRKLNAVKSDLGVISRAHQKKQPKKLNLTHSNETGTKFNGCDTPTKPNKKHKKNKKKKKNKNEEEEGIYPKPKLTKSNSTSYVAEQKKQKRKANESQSTSKGKKGKSKHSTTAKQKNKTKHKSNTKTKTKPKQKQKEKQKQKQTSNHQKKKKKKIRHTVDDSVIMNSELLDNMSYKSIINDKEKFIKYIDNKNFYYHQQFIDEEKEMDDEDHNHKDHKDQSVMINRIKERAMRSPPPTMVSFFSSKSRINQKKKRALPTAPNTYTITIDSRPLGFFIETRKLNTIVEDEQSGEQRIEQVEIVDNKNKFNKVNAYISSIASDEWRDKGLLIGSQLLSINHQSITGLSFAKIFERLTQEKLPFTLKLAAPTNPLKLDLNVTSNDSDNSSINGHLSSPYSPQSPPDSPPHIDIGTGYDTLSNNASNWNAMSDIPRGRGQTIDETKLSKQAEKNKKKFRFRLF